MSQWKSNIRAQEAVVNSANVEMLKEYASQVSQCQSFLTKPRTMEDSLKWTSHIRYCKNQMANLESQIKEYGKNVKRSSYAKTIQGY